MGNKKYWTNELSVSFFFEQQQALNQRFQQQNLTMVLPMGSLGYGLQQQLNPFLGNQVWIAYFSILTNNLWRFAVL